MYQVELGIWDGEQYDYTLVAETVDTSLEYDISQSSFYITPVPAVSDGQQFFFRVRATDGLDYTPYIDISRLVKAPAASSHSFPETNTLNCNENSFSIYGSVEPSIVSAEVALNTFFVIEPNATEADSRFISPVMRVRNLSSMPVEISILSCKATGNAPQIVAPDTFTPEQWLKLGLAESKSIISLGLKGSRNGSFWFDDEASQEGNTLGIFAAGEELDYTLQARFGLVWKEQENFKYNLVFEIRLVR